MQKHLNSPLVFILADTLTPRLQYACRVVFERLLGVSFTVLSSADAVPVLGISLYYTYNQPQPAAGIHVVPHGLLAQTGTDQVPDLHLLTKDPLAAIFWLCTHYAAYHPTHLKDAHGRPARAVLPDFADPFLPTCHVLAHQLSQTLGLELPPMLTEHLYTFDIDNAFAYQAKGPLRWLGGLAKEVAAGGATAVRQRLLHALGKTDDPYDTHQRITEAMAGKAFKVFFLVASGTLYDHAISASHPDYKRLVHLYQQAGAQIGLHPGYSTGQDAASILSEKQTLEGFTAQPITLSRHHYLRLLTPYTQRSLLKAGFTDDYSAGPLEPGFWQGISVSIPWYDVDNDCTTDLQLHPAAWMDVHHTKNPEAGLQQLAQMIKNLKPYGGQLISIWHNDYFIQFSEQKAVTDFILLS